MVNGNQRASIWNTAYYFRRYLTILSLYFEGRYSTIPTPFQPAAEPFPGNRRDQRHDGVSDCGKPELSSPFSVASLCLPKMHVML
jgi:hypothetical protein